MRTKLYEAPPSGWVDLETPSGVFQLDRSLRNPRLDAEGGRPFTIPSPSGFRLTDFEWRLATAFWLIQTLGGETEAAKRVAYSYARNECYARTECWNKMKPRAKRGRRLQYEPVKHCLRIAEPEFFEFPEDSENDD